MTLGSAAPVGERRAAPTLTSDRDETKYFVDRSRIATLVTELTRFIAPFEHVGNARHLPAAHHFSTTVYLDTPSRALYRAARADSTNNVKIRAREYYDLHPSLAELATDPGDVVRYDPTVWFELKERTGTRSTKHRFCLRRPKSLASSPERRRRWTRRPRRPRCASSPCSPRAPRAARRELAGELSARVVPGSEGQLRVTVDVDLAYYAPPADLWTSTRALVRSRLGTPRGRDPRGLIEVNDAASRRSGSRKSWEAPARRSDVQQVREAEGACTAMA